MKWADVVAIASELPEVEESTSWHMPALKVRGKWMAGCRPELGALVLRVADVAEQQFLIEAAPHIYWITDHYKGYPAVLARLSKLGKKECRGRLERAWRTQAPKTLVKNFDAG